MVHLAAFSNSERPSDAGMSHINHGSNKNVTVSVAHFNRVKYLDTESGTFRRAEHILTPPATQDLDLVHGKFSTVATLLSSSRLTLILP